MPSETMKVGKRGTIVIPVSLRLSMAERERYLIGMFLGSIKSKSLLFYLAG